MNAARDFNVDRCLPAEMFLKVARELRGTGRDFFLTLEGPSEFDQPHRNGAPSGKRLTWRNIQLHVDPQKPTADGCYYWDLDNRYLVRCYVGDEESWRDLLDALGEHYDMTNLGENLWDSRIDCERSNPAFFNRVNAQYQLHSKGQSAAEVMEVGKLGDKAETGAEQGAGGLSTDIHVAVHKTVE